MTSAILALVLVCGVEDWAAKTLTDGQPIHRPVVFPDGGSAPVFHVADEITLQPNPGHNEIGMTVYVLAFRLEADEDLHVVVSDAPDWKQTMIAELPAPHCAAGSPHLDQMAKARSDFLAIFGHPLKGGKLRRLKTPVRVIMTGVVYFDHLHGQTGVAPNGVELHPILKVERVP